MVRFEKKKKPVKGRNRLNWAVGVTPRQMKKTLGGSKWRLKRRFDPGGSSDNKKKNGKLGRKREPRDTGGRV